MDWPFEEVQNAAVITLRSILNEGAPVLYVARDAELGWSFMDGNEPTVDEAMVVAFSKVVARDSTLLELSDLPRNWVAWRLTKAAPWLRCPADEAG